jgi:hypothetical protein
MTRRFDAESADILKQIDGWIDEKGFALIYDVQHPTLQFHYTRDEDGFYELTVFITDKPDIGEVRSCGIPADILLDVGVAMRKLISQQYFIH